MTRSNDSTLQFLGAAGTVTGSRNLVETEGRRILVDCGLFQGYKTLRERNWAPFPVPPSSIDAVVLTHAHLDHSGYLPALIKAGFAGPVLCTEGTRDLCGLLLPDSGHLLEEEARFAAEKGYSRHKTPLALYTERDAQRALRALSARPYEEPFEVVPGVTARLHPAGHILGAAHVSLDIAGRRLHFSGDLGRARDALMNPPTPLPECDLLVCESTYGNRTHPDIDAEAELGPVLKRVLGRGGVVVIPAFAVGRAQALMLHIARLRERGEIPKTPVYLNSPMAVDATHLYHRHHHEHRISDAECRAMFEVATFVNDVEASKALNRRHGPMIIVSASGMMTGGRVLHHVEAFGPDPKNAILLAGFQAGGTRGARLAAGERSLRMFGREIPIKAEVVQLGAFSGHADAGEILSWIGTAPTPPKQVWLTHGEPDAADALRLRIERELRIDCHVADAAQRITLDGAPA